MKKPVKITLWTLGVVLGLFAAAVVTTDIWVSRLVHREVKDAFEDIPDVEASIGDIHIFFLSGTAIVEDIYFATNSINRNDTLQSGQRMPGLAINVPTLTVGHISYRKLFREKHLHVSSLTADNPSFVCYLDEKHPEAILPALPKDTTLEDAGQWLKLADLRKIRVNNAHAELYSLNTSLELNIDSLTAQVRDFRYDFGDSLFTYNDSVYEVSVGEASVVIPDSLSSLKIHGFRTKNQGPFHLGYTRYRNTVSPRKLADMHNEPTTWMDLELNSLSTSAFNPLHKILDKDYTLDSLHANVRRMHVHRDARHAPKEPFPIPQDILRRIPEYFCIKQATAVVHKIDIEVTTSDVNCGKLSLNDIHARLDNITNKTGAVWYNRLHAPFGKNGIVDAKFNMYIDHDARFDISISGTDAELQDLNPFIRPLVAITCDCHINKIDANYSGDRQKAKGEFCMQYKGLNVKVHKEDQVPYRIITKYADVFTSLANTLIPKSNPTAVDIHPRSYSVEWKNDAWAPYALYLFGPCIDGVIKTMLPGLFVHKQTKEVHGNLNTYKKKK